ncbi:MAG: hypothetical protein PHE02_14945 [Lachnospiraceae bacterium]|nr:hypothetical protein [Lachnospiraceae bacterium]
MKKYIKLFAVCGVVGWCMEILFTSLHALQRHNFTLTGSTSLFMFPIYGMAVLLCPLHKCLKHCSLLFRGFCYACGIFFVEYLSGSFLMRHHCCPWNYERSPWNIRSVIRLDFFPYWFAAGILYEKILSHLEQ